MKILKALSYKFLYNLFAILLIIELAQGITKYFNPYYFNVVRMGLFAVIVCMLGIKVSAKNSIVYGIFLVSLLLILLMYYVVWN